MKNSIWFILLGFFFANCSAQEEIKSISTVEMKLLLSKGKVQIIDVRTPTEVKGGSIETAFFVNYFDMDFYEKASAKLDKSKPVYIYCRSGNRSRKACALLNLQGFKVINVLGGYNQWRQEN
jgi:rhodanese-related sulfurtransferase